MRKQQLLYQVRPGEILKPEDKILNLQVKCYLHINIKM